MKCRSWKRQGLAPLVSAALFVFAASAQAQATDAEQAGAETPDVERAFNDGVDQMKAQRWGPALASLKVALSGALSARHVAWAQFNMSVCERALSRFVSARQHWLGLVQHPELLTREMLADTQHYLQESDKLIARVTITLDPKSATLLIDDWPLLPHAEGEAHFYPEIQGDAASARSLELQTFTVLLDPGNHLIRAQRAGHGDAVLNRSYKGGEVVNEPLKLAVLPATINVQSKPQGAFIKVDGQSFGVTPGAVQQPAGEHRLTVEHSDYDLHVEDLELQPGERLDLVVPLKPYEPPLLAKGWFWAATGGAVAVAAVITYFAVRPAAQIPAYDGGSSGWVARAP